MKRKLLVLSMSLALGGVLSAQACPHGQRGNQGAGQNQNLSQGRMPPPGQFQRQSFQGGQQAGFGQNQGQNFQPPGNFQANNQQNGFMPPPPPQGFSN